MAIWAICWGILFIIITFIPHVSNYLNSNDKIYHFYNKFSIVLAPNDAYFQPCQ